MLHWIAERDLNPVIVERIGAGDDIVLQSESTWAAYRGHKDNTLLNALLQKPCHVYVMRDLIQAFGMDEQQLLPGVEIIDYDGLVALTVEHPQTQTWC